MRVGVCQPFIVIENTKVQLYVPEVTMEVSREDLESRNLLGRTILGSRNVNDVLTFYITPYLMRDIRDMRWLVDRSGVVPGSGGPIHIRTIPVIGHPHHAEVGEVYYFKGAFLKNNEPITPDAAYAAAREEL